MIEFSKYNGEEYIIDIENATVRFNMATESVDNIKEYFVKLVKRQLMFKEFFAIKDFSLKIKPGEAWGFVGTNGAGKSTLLKLISGILEPYKGKVVVNGTIAPLIELGAGFDMDLTARENIYLNGILLGHSKKFMSEHFDEIVEFAELWDFLDVPIKNYSSGMQARIAFAIATMVKPDILIVDEVLAVGDYKFQAKCQERMKAMLAEGTTLLLVSHNLDDIKRMCDHACWIDKGNIVMSGLVEEVCNNYMPELGENNE
ncbi:MAG: ABC transporter ATP-binding protein [Lachnospiraceae bacterium]|nr:ABC transporter ATP-binding protein [Lachnospiraceae bacterium]